MSAPIVVHVPGTEVAQKPCCKRGGLIFVVAALLCGVGAVAGAFPAEELRGADELAALGWAALIAAPFWLLLTLLAGARAAGRDDARRFVGLVAGAAPLALVPLAWGLLLQSNRVFDDSPPRQVEVAVLRSWRSDDGHLKAELQGPGPSETRTIRLRAWSGTVAPRLRLTLQDGALGWERLTTLTAAREP